MSTVEVSHFVCWTRFYNSMRVDVRLHTPFVYLCVCVRDTMTLDSHYIRSDTVTRALTQLLVHSVYLHHETVDSHFALHNAYIGHVCFRRVEYGSANRRLNQWIELFFSFLQMPIIHLSYKLYENPLKSMMRYLSLVLCHPPTKYAVLQTMALTTSSSPMMTQWKRRRRLHTQIHYMHSRRSVWHQR